MAITDIDTFRLSLKAECARLSLPLAEELLDSLALHYELLVNWNRRIRLVGSAQPRRAASELFADSLAAGAFSDAFALSPQMIDIGSGAGFPGIPIKAAHPERRLALIDPNAKKYSFLKTLVQRLGLSQVLLERARAEDKAHDPAWRKRFDLAFCRAVAHPAVALELAVPFLKVGGSFVLQATEFAEPDHRLLEKVAGMLGATIAQSKSYELSHPKAPRLLIRVLKTAATPPEYPRRASLMKRHPLG